MARTTTTARTAAARVPIPAIRVPRRRGQRIGRDEGGIDTGGGVYAAGDTGGGVGAARCVVTVADPALSSAAAPTSVGTRRSAATGGSAGTCGDGGFACSGTGADHAPGVRSEASLVGTDEVGQGLRPEGGRGGHRGQVGGDDLHQLGQRRAIIRTFNQAARDQAGQRGRQAVQHRLTVHDPVDHGDGVAVAERSRSGRGEGHHSAEREHIGGRADGCPGRLLRRHERGSAHDHPGAGQRGAVQSTGDAEIDHPGAVGCEQHIRRFKVTVHQTAGVHLGQCLGQARGQPPHRDLGQRPLLLDRIGQRRAHDEGRRQPRRIPLAGVDHRRGVGATHLPRGRHLLLEPVEERLVPGQFRVDHLHGHRASGRREAQEHLAHPTRAQPGHQLVPPDLARIFPLSGSITVPINSEMRRSSPPTAGGMDALSAGIRAQRA